MKLLESVKTMQLESFRKALMIQMKKRLKPPPRLTVSEWADNFRKLSAESSAEPGSWQTSRAEYQRGIMDAISDPSIETVVLMMGAQMGKSECLNNVVGYHIAQDPSPILVVQPTLDMAQTWSKDRLAPMLRDTPALQGLVKDPRSRDSGNTTLHKSFPGGHVTGCGANSPASLASRPIRIVLCDEVDRFPVSAGTEGDPVTLARKRSATFWNRKIILVSTPTNKGASRIEQAYEESDKRLYYVPCHDCGHEQTLKWSQVKFDADRPETAGYACESCGAIWDDASRARAVRRGEWRSTEKFAKTAGFCVSGLYSPWIPLEDAVRDFLAARKQPSTLRVWVNTYLAETWEEDGEGVDDYSLSERAEDWGDIVPADGLILTAGVDVQDDRLEAEIVAWGKEEESWSIAYRTIHGDPSGPIVWRELDEFLYGVYEHEFGEEMVVRATCIDSGGHHTQAVYKYVSTREAKRVFAIKGVGGEGKPMVGKPSKNNIGKIKLFPVGVDTIKYELFSRFRITEPGPGYCHFPEGRDPEYYKQLTAEKIATKYHKGFARREFVKIRTRNEALDVRVYAKAALALLNVNLNGLAMKMSHRKEAQVEVKQQKQPVRPKNPSSFVNRWR
jgi:phage terminase large subunit GpA-like protein